MKKPKLKIICLTPIRNESWILDRFLQAASLWADHIIIADQMSTDGSREIAKKYPKVILIDNPSETFNESERQKLLISEARKIKGPRLLITLDADEMFTPNFLFSKEWLTILSSSPGTIFKFQWANFLPNMKTMWLSDIFFPWGYMDDDCEHTENTKIHSARIPLPVNHPIIQLNDIKVIHFQYTNWDRMQSKHIWYQCYERTIYPQKSALDIFRFYHHMYTLTDEQIILIPKNWIEQYRNLNINILEVIKERKNWFDEKTLDLMDKHGTDYFKKLIIWNINWKKKAKLFERKKPSKYKDPRGMLEKIIQWWIWKTKSSYIKKINAKIERKIRCHYNY